VNDKIIISICGAAGSGKSTLAKRLVRNIGSDMASRIPTDYYLKSYNGEDIEEYMNTPFKYDWALLKPVFEKPIGVMCETPDFDFNKLIRLDRTGGKPFTTRRYMVLDSMLPYPDSNFVFELDTPEDLRLKNVKERDRAQKTNSLRNWKKMEATARELESNDHKYDMMLSGFADVDVNAEKIKEFLGI
jgi:uridine kinase